MKIIGMSKPIPFRLNDANALKLLREIAADSSRVVMLRHAMQRMRERKVTLTQVLDVLRKGCLTEPSALDMHGNWKVTVKGMSCGQSLTVAAAIEMGQEHGKRILVITLFGGN